MLLSATKDYTKFLEDYGYKERVAEKFQVEQTESLRKQSEDRLKSYIKLKELPKEQQELIRKVMLGDDTNSEQSTS